MAAVMELRTQYKAVYEEKHSIKLGFMSFFVKASIEALKAFPQVNAEVRGTDIVYKNYFDIGIAVGAGKGLVVPVLRNAERMGFAEIELAIADFGNARPGRDEAIDEAADRLIASGRLTHDVSARLNWNYGRELRVEGSDGNSYTDAIFLIGNKLVQLKVIYPLSSSQAAGSSGIHYFQQAMRLLS